MKSLRKGIENVTYKKGYMTALILLASDDFKLLNRIIDYSHILLSDAQPSHVARSIVLSRSEERRSEQR